MRQLKKETRIRIVRDITGDIPKSLLHRNGTILYRDRDEERDGYEPVKAYRVKMDNRKKLFTVFDDEIKVI